MFSRIKTPLKFLASDIQSHIRSGWRILKHYEMLGRSCFETTILPVWEFLKSWYLHIRSLVSPTKQSADVSEITPLLESDWESVNEVESVCSQPPIRSGVPVKPLDFRIRAHADDVPKTPRLMYYTVAPYCALCRKEFRSRSKVYSDPQDVRPGEPDGSKLYWEFIMLAICPADFGSQKRYFAVKLEPLHSKNVGFPPIGLQDDPPIMARVDILDDKERQGRKSEKIDDPDRAYRDEAVAVHRFCRNMAASIFKDRPLHQTIWQFGQSTRYLARTASSEKSWKGNLRSILPYFKQFNQGSELIYLLSRLSQLPPEIENEIRRHIQSTTLSCLVNFVRTTVPLMRSMSKAKPPTELLFHKSTPFLCATSTTIYEVPLIQRLNLVVKAHDDMVESVSTLPRTVTTRNVEGIQVLPGQLGTGISAVRLLYADGCVSHWTGFVFDECDYDFVTILGREVSGLRIHQDSLKITKIELIAKRSWNVHRTEYFHSIGFPWYPQKKNYMLPRSASPSSVPFPSWRDNEQKSGRKRNFNTWDVGQYVSLVEGYDFYESLTVYCLPNSVCGIALDEALASKRILLGAQNPAAVALHIQLGRAEKLKHILVDLDALEAVGTWGKDHCPPFMITTTHSRLLMCSSLKLSDSSTGLPRFGFVSDAQKCDLTGLFTDGTSNADGSLRNLGLTYNIQFDTENPFGVRKVPEASMKKEAEVISRPLPDSKFLPSGWSTAFMNVASLADADKIKTWTRGGRILGLKLSYHAESHSAILGQYDLSFPTEISTIYDSTIDGDFQSIRFEYGMKRKVGWLDSDSKYISRMIITCSDKLIFSEKEASQINKEVPSFTWAIGSDQKNIAWLFNSANDHLEYWNETTEDVELVPIKTKELRLNPGIELPERQLDRGFVLWDEHPYEGSSGEESEDERLF